MQALPQAQHLLPARHAPKCRFVPFRSSKQLIRARLGTSNAAQQQQQLVECSLARSSNLLALADAKRLARDFLKTPGVKLTGAALVAALGGLAACHPAQAAAVLANIDSAAFIPGIVGDDPLREGFIQALLLILFSEIGDKTFFIAVLLATQQPKSAVFAGTFGALAVMTVISVALGEAIHELDNLLPASSLPFDDLLACALLVFFGIRTLQDAAGAEGKAAEEREEAEEVVSGMGGGAASLSMVASTFALVFAAEWGDKSFLATIALAAASSPLGVVGGAVAGHGIATVIAVLGGSALGKYLSERTVQYVGGSLFLVFAAATAFDIFSGQSG